MKASLMILAMLTCAMLTFKAGAIESPSEGGVTAADSGKTAGRSTMRPNAKAMADRSGGGESARAGASRNAALKSRDPAAGSRLGGPEMQSHRIALKPQGNADRLHSLLNAQSRGRIARQPGRSVGAKRMTGGAQGIRAPLGVRATAPALIASTRAATPVPMHSMLGGSQLQAPARIDGRAFTKTALGAAIDGTQLQLTRHRKSPVY